MALAEHALKTLAPHMKGARILSLGYPDILATPEQCEAIFGVKPQAMIDAGAQHDIKRPLVETMALVKLLGAELACVDVIRWRGFERVLDLNEPHDLGAFDLVIDPGTTEHCFNVGQAIMNGARAVRPGGRIYHSLPLAMMNHGFWNVCPTALWDFYTQNGWRLELFEVRLGERAVALDETGAHTRNVSFRPETGLIALAQRVTEQPLRWPVQAKYLDMKKRAAA